jgi:hypothetical protein
MLAGRESSARTGGTPRGQEQVSYRTYEVTFSGQAGNTARAEFEDCEIIVGPRSTTLRATLPDQSALAGLIERLLALHCELLRVDVLPSPQSPPRAPGGYPSPPRLPGDPGAQVVFDTVNRLFSVGLTLTNALGLIGPGAAADRVGAAIGELDDIIRDIRAAAFGYVTAGPADQPASTR